jgi:hypothetical protein
MVCINISWFERLRIALYERKEIHADRFNFVQCLPHIGFQCVFSAQERFSIKAIILLICVFIVLLNYPNLYFLTYFV